VTSNNYIANVNLVYNTWHIWHTIRSSMQAVFVVEIILAAIWNLRSAFAIATDAATICN